MFSEIIKSYKQESTDIVKEIYAECAVHFQGRHYAKHREFILNTPANIKCESLYKILDGMIGNNEKLKKVSNQMSDCFGDMYSFTHDFYYICGLRDFVNIKNDADLETHIEKMLVMHRSKTYEEFWNDTRYYIKQVSRIKRCKDIITKELGENAEKVLSDIETAEHEANETNVLIDYIGGVYDAKLTMKFINEYPN